MYKLGLEESDSLILEDCREKTLKILVDIREFEIKCFLSGEDDNLDIYLEIYHKYITLPSSLITDRDIESYFLND